MHWREPLKFIAVGLISLAVNFAVFRTLFVWLAPAVSGPADHGLQLAPALAAGIATAAGYCAGVTNGFVLNRAWTFKAPPAPGQLSRFVALNAFSLVAGSAAIIVLVDRLAVAAGLAWFLVTAATTVMNFFGSKFWAFAPQPTMEIDTASVTD